jgi:membrane protease YdiL (CAAX protease family)
VTVEEDNSPVLRPPQPPDPAPQSVRAIPPAEPSLGPDPSILEREVPAASQRIPEDLRTPWDWIDLITFALLVVGGTFTISVLLVLVFSAFGIGPAELRASATARSYFAIVNQVVLSLALFGYLVTQTRLRVRQPFWRTIGWRPLPAGRVSKSLACAGFIAAGLLLSMLVQFASGLTRPKGELPIETFFQDRRSALLLMAISVTLAPLVEETIFRGYIYPVVARHFGITTSIVATGTLFGLLHAPQLWGGWLQIGLLILVGIIFTYVRAATRTVLASYLLHVSYNSFLLIAFLLGSHWLRSPPPMH